MLLKRLTSVQVLSDITELLSKGENGREQITGALSLLGTFMRAQGAALIRKKIVEGEAYILECLGSSNSQPGGMIGVAPNFELLRPEQLPQEWWKQLGMHQIVLIKSPLNIGLLNFSTLLLIPIFLEENLSGFLVLWNILNKRFSSSMHHFIRGTSYLFGFWTAKLDIKKRLRDFIDAIPFSIVTLNVDGEITGWNRATEEMTGWKAERILGKGNYEQSIPYFGERRPTVPNLILNPDPKWEATYPEFRREGDDVYSLVHCAGLPEGGAFIRCKTSKIYDVNNRLCEIIHAVRDVTWERRIEKNLHQSESMYQTITDFAGIGMILFRREKVIYYNEQFLKFIGVSREGLTINKLIEWALSEDREKLSQNLEDLFRGKQEVIRFEFRAYGKDGIRYYSCYAQVIEYEEKPTIHFILDDITEQKELAHKVRLNELRLYHDDRLTALGTMAAGIAHELNQPLNTIRVVTDGLLFGKDEGWPLNQEELYDNLNTISRQVIRMSEVIWNIRDFSREDRSQGEEEINPNDAVRNVFSMMGRQLEVHGIQVKQILEPNLPPIKANFNRLEQVIMNLVVNALQALDDCSRNDKELWVCTGRKNGAVFINVCDNAIGIPEDLMIKIFTPFFTTKEAGKGTGLGLSICQSIVGEFKGRINVFNNDKGGASFVVMAPACGGSV